MAGEHLVLFLLSRVGQVVCVANVIVAEGRAGLMNVLLRNHGHLLLSQLMRLELLELLQLWNVSALNRKILMMQMLI